MLYYDQETGQFEADVRIINVDEDSNQVRISGSMRLNPIDKNYPDKKWININCIYDNNIIICFNLWEFNILKKLCILV